jgi:hypothetical protein
MKQMELELLLDKNSAFYNPITEELIDRVREFRIPDYFDTAEIEVWTNYNTEVDERETPKWCGLRHCPSHNWLEDKCECLRASFSSYDSKQAYTRHYLKQLLLGVKAEFPELQ